MVTQTQKRWERKIASLFTFLITTSVEDGGGEESLEVWVTLVCDSFVFGNTVVAEEEEEERGEGKGEGEIDGDGDGERFGDVPDVDGEEVCEYG